MTEVEARRVRKLGFPPRFIRLFELESQRSLSYEELVSHQVKCPRSGDEHSHNYHCVYALRFNAKNVLLFSKLFHARIAHTHTTYI